MIWLWPTGPYPEFSLFYAYKSALKSEFDSNRRLLIDLRQLIIEFGALSRYKEFDTRPYKEQKVDAPKAVSYEVIKNDTNNDKLLDGKDKRTFALSKIDGSNYSEVISGYNRIVESNLNAEGNLFVVFINNDEVYSMLIDLDTFEVISKSMLPKVGEWN